MLVILVLFDSVDVDAGEIATSLVRSRVGIILQRPHCLTTQGSYDDVISSIRCHGVR